MCGLVGIIGDLEHKDEAVMKRLLYIDLFRGADSTGFASVKKNLTDFNLVKIPSVPTDLFDMGKFKTALSGYNSAVFLGHNRAATRGVVNHANAHPFQVEHIIGAHNGTLDYASQEALEKVLGEKFSVDSLAVFTAIARLGIAEAVKYFKGAWSLTWVDLKEGTFNMLRNKERPMWYAYFDEGNALMYASEWRIIDAAIGLGGGYSRDLVRDKDGNAYFPTTEDLHYSIPLEKMLKEKKVITKAKVVERKGGELVKSYSYTSRPPASDPFQRGGQQSGTGTSTTASSTTTSHRGSTNSKNSPTDNTKKDVILFEGVSDDTNPFAGKISREDFESLAQYGCSFCACSIPWEDAKGVAVWQRDDIILCRNCSPQNDNNNRLYILANPHQ